MIDTPPPSAKHGYNMGHKLRDLASEITLGSHISCGEAPLVYKRATTLSILMMHGSSLAKKTSFVQ